MALDRIQLLNDMLKKDPEDSFLSYALALEYVKSDQAKAVELLEKVLKEKPNYLATYYQLGKLYEQSGKTQEAIEVYQKGMTLAQAQNNIKTMGELNEALLMLDDE